MRLVNGIAVTFWLLAVVSCGSSDESGASTDGGSSGGSGGSSGSGGEPWPAAQVECDLPDVDGTGPVTYVCDCDTDAASDCVPGDDGNSGSSPDEPLRSYEAARSAFDDLGAGGMVALCRGGSFRTSGDASASRWVNSSCKADDRCVVRDYVPSWGSESLGAPIVWTDGEEAFRFDDSGDGAHEEGYVFANVDVRCEQEDGTTGFYFFNDVDDVLLCGVGIRGCGFGVRVSGSNPPEDDGDGRNERIVMRSSRVTDNRSQGWLGGCDGCAIEYSYFENNGYGTTVRDHHIYLDDPGQYMKTGERVVGNELYRSSIVDGVCSGVSLVVHGEHQDLLIEDNIVREDVGAVDSRCWGISVDTGYSSDPETFRNVVIRGNQVFNLGRVSIGLNGCQGCTIEDNVIVQEQDGFDAMGISVPVRDRGDNDQAGSDVVIRNNSILMNGSNHLGVNFGEEGTGHKSVNNVVQYTGTGRFDCFLYSSPVDSYDVIDNNLCYAPDASEFSWEDNTRDLTEWQSSTGFDQASSIADPMFTSVTGPDYDLSASSDDSPMVDNGHPSESSPQDIDGNERDADPDIGAYER